MRRAVSGQRSEAIYNSNDSAGIIEGIKRSAAGESYKGEGQKEKSRSPDGESQSRDRGMRTRHLE